MTCQRETTLLFKKSTSPNGPRKCVFSAVSQFLFLLWDAPGKVIASAPSTTLTQTEQPLYNVSSFLKIFQNTKATKIERLQDLNLKIKKTYQKEQREKELSFPLFLPKIKSAWVARVYISITNHISIDEDCRLIHLITYEQRNTVNHHQQHQGGPDRYEFCSSFISLKKMYAKKNVSIPTQYAETPLGKWLYMAAILKSIYIFFPVKCKNICSHVHWKLCLIC